MSSIKISNLNEKTQAGVNDLFPIVDSTTNETKKITGANLLNNQYSTSEIKTNLRWIDGKPIYRKVLTISQLPVPSTQSGYAYNSYSIDVDVSVLDKITNIYGTYYSSNNNIYPINTSRLVTNQGYIDDAQIGTWVTSSSFNVNVFVFVSKLLLLTTGNVTIEYTKTTD